MIMNSDEESFIIFYFVASQTTVFIDAIYKFYFKKTHYKRKIILNHIRRYLGIINI